MIKHKFEKIAGQSSLMQDFVAGYDPFGVWTQQYGKANEIAELSDAEHRFKNTVGIAGGLLGGATLVPSVVSGGIGLLKSKGKDWSGFKKPFKQVKELTQARNAAAAMRAENSRGGGARALGKTINDRINAEADDLITARLRANGYNPLDEVESAGLYAEAREQVLQRYKARVDAGIGTRSLGDPSIPGLVNRHDLSAEEVNSLRKQFGQVETGLSHSTLGSGAKHRGIFEENAQNINHMDFAHFNQSGSSRDLMKNRVRAQERDYVNSVLAHGDETDRLLLHARQNASSTMPKARAQLSELHEQMAQGKKDAMSNLILGGGFGAAGAGIQYNVGRREGREYNSNWHLPKFWKQSEINELHHRVVENTLDTTEKNASVLGRTLGGGALGAVTGGLAGRGIQDAPSDGHWWEASEPVGDYSTSGALLGGAVGALGGRRYGKKLLDLSNSRRLQDASAKELKLMSDDFSAANKAHDAAYARKSKELELQEAQTLKMNRAYVDAEDTHEMSIKLKDYALKKRKEEIRQLEEQSKIESERWVRSIQDNEMLKREIKNTNARNIDDQLRYRNYEIALENPEMLRHMQGIRGKVTADAASLKSSPYDWSAPGAYTPTSDNRSKLESIQEALTHLDRQTHQRLNAQLA